MRYIITILAAFITTIAFGQSGYSPINSKQWNKDTVLNTKAMKINSQGGLVVGTYDLNGNALLELNSTTKGFLPTRLTTAQQNAMSLVANGMIIYNTDSNDLFRYDSDGGWRRVGGAVGGGTYTFNNGLTESAGTVKLGGTLSQNTTINKDTFNFTIQQGTFPTLQHFFNIGTFPSLDPTLNGFIYAKVLGGTATILRSDSASQFIGRTNFVTGRGAGLTIKNERNSSVGSPDIVLEAKKTNTSGRFGFSADTGSCEIFQFDPNENRDVTFLGVDFGHRRANIYSRRKDSTIAAEITIDTLTGIKFIHENNFNKGYIFPRDTPQLNQVLTAVSGDGNGNMQLGWVQNNRTIQSVAFGDTVNHNPIYGYYTFNSSTGAATFNLSTSAAIGTEVIIKDGLAQALTNNITIDAGVGNVIVGTSAAQTYVINTNGQSVSLKKVSATNWEIF